MTTILMTADAVGGVWTYALELARALAPQGVRVALATMGALPSESQRAEAAAVPGLTLHPGEYRLEWMPDPWEDVARAGDWLLALEKQIAPDVVHLNGYAHGALPWRAPVVMVAHSCVLSWWRAVKGVSAPPEWDHYAQEVRRGLGAAAIVAAPTQAMLEALATEYGPLPMGCVIPNGRDSALFTPGLKEPFVFSAGRLWDEAKNVAALAEVAPCLPWPVYLAGDDGDAPPLPGVNLLGLLSLTEVAAWMSRAATYALPARYEPFGLGALEAALSGCALVLGDIPSLREVWADAAVFVPPGDADALHGALHGLILDDAERHRMAARAHARALLYTPQRMADGYLKLYQEALTEERTCASSCSPIP